jgi:AbrB family looped-hinge helix DNA binding protein
MTGNERLTTRVSTKGQVILPKAIRQQRRWEPGTRLVVEDTPDGVLLKAVPLFAPTRPEDVYGSLLPKGAAKTLEEMDASIVVEAQRRHRVRLGDDRLHDDFGPKLLARTGRVAKDLDLEF